MKWITYVPKNDFSSFESTLSTAFDLVWSKKNKAFHQNNGIHNKVRKKIKQDLYYN